MRPATSDLKAVLHRKGLRQRDQILLALASLGEGAHSVGQVKLAAVNAGLRKANQWNISELLARAKKDEQAILMPIGWELTPGGLNRVAELSGTHGQRPSSASVAHLEQLVSQIQDSQVRCFLEEAVSGARHGLKRSAVVFTWVGAVSLLYSEVIANHLQDFNNEAIRTEAGWKFAKTTDDLARMKEHKFLEILERISVIGKSVKKQLQQRLDLRNDCGHPNSYQIGDAQVANHIEVLVLNVLQRFA